MAGRVLDISKYEHGTKHDRPAIYDNAVKHENALRTTRPPTVGAHARLYRFPSPTPGATPQSIHQDLAVQPKSRFRLEVALELAVGLFMWLTWMVWQHLH